MLNKLQKAFFGKRILIVGLGTEGGGVGAVRFFLNLGAKITVTDIKSRNELSESLSKLPLKSIELVLGKHREKDFLGNDLIIKNPGVPWDVSYIKTAISAGIPVMTDAQIFFEYIPRERIIGITGTKGKTTCAMFLKHILDSKFKIKIIGTPGTSSLTELLKNKHPDYFIYELSSFDLENLNISPKYAVVTNIFQDHINRHKTFSEYKKIKQNIFKHQSRGAILFADHVDPQTKKSLDKKGVKIKIFSQSADQRDPQCLMSPTSIGAALAVASHLGISDKTIQKQLDSFEPLEDRLEDLGIINSIRVINNTTATNPEATIFSLERIKKCLGCSWNDIIVIAGGEDKNLSYNELAKFLNKVKKVVLLPGSASEKLKSYSLANMVGASSMQEAVEKSFKSAQKGDCVVLSPSASSLNMFRNEFDRGREFKRCIKNLKNKIA